MYSEGNLFQSSPLVMPRFRFTEVEVLQVIEVSYCHLVTVQMPITNKTGAHTLQLSCPSYRE